MPKNAQKVYYNDITLQICIFIIDAYFHTEMASAVKNENWLGDDHIHLAQELLRKQFPLIDWLQSTLLSQNDGFVPVHYEGS